MHTSADFPLLCIQLKVEVVQEVTIKMEDFSEKEPKPQPEGMGIIADYLASKKQRLIDLFSQADKDKSWAITRDEFRKCIKEVGRVVHTNNHITIILQPF